MLKNSFHARSRAFREGEPSRMMRLVRVIGKIELSEVENRMAPVSLPFKERPADRVFAEERLFMVKSSLALSARRLRHSARVGKESGQALLKIGTYP